MPHYFNPISVGPGPSQNWTCRFPASSSSGRFTGQQRKSSGTFESLAAIPVSRFTSVDNTFPGSGSCIVSPPRTTCRSIPSLHRHYPASSVLWIDPTTCTSSSNLVASVPSTPLSEEGTGPPRFLKNPLHNMPWTMTPVEYPPSRL